MKILMVGQGKGSFEVRGRQLGKALGARVVTVPSDDDLRWADVVVLVKRAGMDWATFVHDFKKPVVWDALDFWQQPEQNHLGEIQAKALLHDTIKRIRPALTIGATQAMATEAHGVYLPHHARAGLTPTVARDTVSVVGYEGHKKWLGQWGKAVAHECKRRGWTFIINPPDLRSCDILVAFRDGQWDGWMCRQWKSGVKLVNAMAAGRPSITQPSAAMTELGTMGTVIDTPTQLSGAFDDWVPQSMREAAASRTVYTWEPDYTLRAVAERYRHMLESVVKVKAA